MFDKYEGPWRLHFVTISEDGEIDIVRQDDFYHLDAIEPNGTITRARDNEDNELQGHFSKQRGLDIIRMQRTNGTRHFRGINAFEQPLGGGVMQIVLVGERRPREIPEDEPMKGTEFTGERREDAKQKAERQEDGVWIATKP